MDTEYARERGAMYRKDERECGSGTITRTERKQFDGNERED